MTLHYGIGIANVMFDLLTRQRAIAGRKGEAAFSGNTKPLRVAVLTFVSG